MMSWDRCSSVLHIAYVGRSPTTDHHSEKTCISRKKWDPVRFDFHIDRINFRVLSSYELFDVGVLPWRRDCTTDHFGGTAVMAARREEKGAVGGRRGRRRIRLPLLSDGGENFSTSMGLGGRRGRCRWDGGTEYVCGNTLDTFY
ncbi:hypothetical protein GWI33_014614 [Rhynchophorus ferrugineus]|uniref:Uncharacterized protein n=1 Tax=Rhynchophorus ferrugineus TaxID=354439 RepID=A0A834I2B0_RHYFE|nr:hypothetical protein GWI33_014614 [Rhynchophorus ferrugineus]